MIAIARERKREKERERESVIETNFGLRKKNTKLGKVDNDDTIVSAAQRSGVHEEREFEIISAGKREEREVSPPTRARRFQSGEPR
jgi:hypothetical protein